MRHVMFLDTKILTVISSVNIFSGDGAWSLNCSKYICLITTVSNNNA